MNQRFEKHEKFRMENGCPAKACEEVTVTVPITVSACSEVGDVTLQCMGHAVITRNDDDPPGCPCAVSKFTISQKMRVDIPIIFFAEADVGEGHVDFEWNDKPEHCVCSELKK